MAKSLWEQAVARSAAPERAAKYGPQILPLLGEEAISTPDQAAVYAAVFSGSLALTELLITRPDWAGAVNYEELLRPRLRQGLARQLGARVDPLLKQRDFNGALKEVREFKQREMLRIGARDLARIGHVLEIIEEISNVADLCIDLVCRICFMGLQGKFGTPYTQEAGGRWEPSEFCVLGMGKLGGQELNYSSDIDVLFVYTGEGDVFKTAPTKKARPTLKNHQFYARLCEAIIAECTRMTGQGFLYRIDMRLRPEGKTAPLARSLASYETYYAQWGQTWERMMLIKARCVAGDQSLGAEFLEMVQPFRYPRSISADIPREVGEMKARIENEVIRSGELERNVKLGRGGIREIEFLAQTLQVLNAGRLPFLQGAKTIPALAKLAEYKLIAQDEAECLRAAYCFLRDVEHRLQMEDNRQTHTIPTSSEARTRLARLMGFEKLAAFEKALQTHTGHVRAAYDRFIQPGNASTDRLPREISENAAHWKEILHEHSFRDPDRCVKLLQEFVHGPGFGHVSTRTIDNSLTLIADFLKMCRQRSSAENPPEPFLSDPDRVLARLDSYVGRYGARSTLFEAWVSNTSLFRLLLLAFDRSEFLAELAIRDPGLIDEIEQSGQLRRRKTTEQILADLRYGAGDADQHFWLRRYYHAEQMRIGLRDILGLADPRQTQDEITSLADAFLSYALEVVLKKHRLKKCPFAIFGLGKLGGRELIYASDLDIIFVAEDKTSNLAPLQKVAVDLMDLLSRRTEHGTTFLTDARLRPDGEKGLLLNSMNSYADYYGKRAMLWEIQSLSRFRPITGNASVMAGFSELARGLTSVPNAPARFGEWKGAIHQMRMRIQKERTPAGKEKLAIKTGAGGLMDVEFVAQALCLENGWHQPNTLAAVERAASEKILPRNSAEILSVNYRKLMEVERILRRWSFEAESILPDDPAPFYRVSVRCGFQEPAEFQAAVDGWRRAVRGEYNRFFAVTR